MPTIICSSKQAVVHRMLICGGCGAPAARQVCGSLQRRLSTCDGAASLHPSFLLLRKSAVPEYTVGLMRARRSARPAQRPETQLQQSLPTVPTRWRLFLSASVPAINLVPQVETTLYRHERTGAEVLSVRAPEDDNKVACAQ